MSQSVVLVTGSSTGIGLATVKQLAEAGYRVYATVRNPGCSPELQALAATLNNVIIELMDVTSIDSVNQTVSKINIKEKRIDVLINNAGFGVYGPSETHSINQIKQLFKTNVLGVVHLTKAVLPIMRKQNHGTIVNLSSVAGVIPSGNIPHYAACKAYVEHLSASDRLHLAKWNIKVILIQPGPVVTNFIGRTKDGESFTQEENPYKETISSNRKAWEKMMEEGQTPEEVAKVIKMALESSNPKLWYQTSQVISDKIAKHHIDITGNGRVPQPTSLTTKSIHAIKTQIQITPNSKL